MAADRLTVIWDSTCQCQSQQSLMKDVNLFLSQYKRWTAAALVLSHSLSCILKKELIKIYFDSLKKKVSTKVERPWRCQLAFTRKRWWRIGNCTHWLPYLSLTFLHCYFVDTLLIFFFSLPALKHIMQSHVGVCCTDITFVMTLMNILRCGGGCCLNWILLLREDHKALHGS